MDALPLPKPPFNDGRGQYPESVSASVPAGFPRLLRTAAHAEGVSAAEFIRRALSGRIQDFLDRASAAEDACE